MEKCGEKCMRTAFYARGQHFMHFFSFYIITNGRNEEGAYCSSIIIYLFLASIFHEFEYNNLSFVMIEFNILVFLLISVENNLGFVD